jgi:hypothetical protein
MPEALLVRIIRASCPPGGLVVDPFAGSGTTLVAAAKLGRQFYGIELSKRYATAAQKRVKAALQTVSQPRHADAWPEEHVEELKRWYQENEVPTDRLNDNPGLLMAFVQRLNARLGDCQYEPEEVMQRLKRLRKAAALPRIRAHVTEKEVARGRARSARRQAEPTLFDGNSSDSLRTGGRLPGLRR